jgi:DNA-binding NarL/FixJ family response regulator
MLQLQPYAELTAALRREPNRRAEILRAASFPDEASFLQIARVWATRFLESPALQQRFETAVERVLRGGRSS